MTTRRSAPPSTPPRAAASWRFTTGTVWPASRSARVSPTHSTGTRLAARAAAVFLRVSSSVSPNSWRRSEWPTRVALAPAWAARGAETAPGKAPFAFQELEGRPAARRDVGQLRCEAGHGGRRVAAAHHRGGPPARRLHHRHGHGARPGVERRMLEHAHRAVPDHGLRPEQARAVVEARGLVDVEHGPIQRHLVAQDLAALGRALETRCDHGPARQNELLAGAREETLGEVHLVAFHERPADAETQGQKERVRHRPADERSEDRRVGKECRSRWSPYH